MGNLFRTGGGKIKRTQIFSGDSRADHKVDLTSYDGWQNFTLDNFCISNCNITRTNYIDPSSVDNIISNYDQKTGILTLKKSAWVASEYHEFLIAYSVDLITV